MKNGKKRAARRSTAGKLCEQVGKDRNLINQLSLMSYFTTPYLLQTVICMSLVGHARPGVDMMSASTIPKHSDLLVALADLPPTKVERFAIALGVPNRVIEESQTSHPRSVYRMKSDALSWWVANEEASWEAVAAALEATGVDERNLAIQIRTSHGIEDGNSSQQSVT